MLIHIIIHTCYLYVHHHISSSILIQSQISEVIYFETFITHQLSIKTTTKHHQRDAQGCPKIPTKDRKEQNNRCCYCTGCLATPEAEAHLFISFIPKIVVKLLRLKMMLFTKYNTIHTLGLKNY